VLVVIGKYVPQMQFLGILLGDEPVLSPSERFYQRLLALDAEESADIVHEFRKQMSLENVYDQVLLPALAHAEQDRHRGALDERRKSFIRQTFRDIIEEMGDEERSTRAVDVAKGQVEEEHADIAKDEQAVAAHLKIPDGCKISVVCLPARDEADEIAALMLAQLLELRGYCAFAVSQTRLASEMLAEVDKREADAIIVSALPPAAVAHSRYLCKRLQSEYPDRSTIVGLWTYSGNIEKARDRISCVASVQLVATLAEMQTCLDQLMHQKIVERSTDTEVKDHPASAPAAT